MGQFLNDFKHNLYSGFRFAVFRPCEPSDFRPSPDQLALLVALDLLLEIGFDFVLMLPEPEFNLYALPTYTFNLACFLFAAYLIGKLFQNQFAAVEIGIIVYSFGPFTIFLQFLMTCLSVRMAVDIPEFWLWLSRAFSAYVAMLLFRTLYWVSQRLKLMTVSAFVLMVFAVSATQILYEDYDDFWFAAETDSDAARTDPYADYRALDAEALMYRQPLLINKALDKLRPQRKNLTEIFFVGFAGYATEDVFSKEVDYIRRLLDERFDTKGHSLNLVNHLDTIDTTPLATSTNLAMALKRIGKIMNVNDDVLLLYLTSHGSKNHKLSVSFWPLALNDITPEKLNAMLDEAGIKWRVIIISACYSGGFVNALQGPQTLVATAAAADKTSFGCGTESEFTYFGEAVFKEQLHRHTSFIAALQQANISIGKREIREKLEASSPQLSVGAAIAAKLDRLGKDMHQRQCGAAKMQATSC